MEIKSVFTILKNKGFDIFSGTSGNSLINFTFSKGKRPDTVNIVWTSENLFTIKLNVKETVFTIVKTEYMDLDLNELILILKKL